MHAATWTYLEIIRSERSSECTWYDPTCVKYTEPANPSRERVDKKSLGTQAKGERTLSASKCEILGEDENNNIVNLDTPLLNCYRKSNLPSNV